MRSGTRAAAVAGMVALGAAGVVACGQGSGPHSGPPRARSGEGSAAHVVQAAYAATRNARTATFRLSETIQPHGSGGTPQRATVTAAGRADFAAEAFTANVNLPAGGTVRILLVHGTEYIAVPPAVRSQIPGHKAWVSLNLNKISRAKLGVPYSELASTGTNNPAQVLSQLSAVATRVSRVGSATVAGVPTTEYRADVNLDKVAARAQAKEGPAAAGAIRQEIKVLRTATLPVDVWIDAHHLVRQVHYQVPVPATSTGASGGTAALTMTLTSFGTPVNLTPPPASQTADITNVVLGAAPASLG